MPGRLPTKADFPSSATLSITPRMSHLAVLLLLLLTFAAPSSQPPTNILILLHGLGDTNAPFTKLGEQLNLPETACEDMIFDSSTGEMDMDTGLQGSTRLVLDQIIREGLIGKCGYKGREIMIFGFAQGGMVGLQVAAELEEELGGVISIGGPLSQSVSLKALQNKSKTPVLVCKANKKSAVTDSATTKLKEERRRYAK